MTFSHIPTDRCAVGRTGAGADGPAADSRQTHFWCVWLKIDSRAAKVNLENPPFRTLSKSFFFLSRPTPEKPAAGARDPFSADAGAYRGRRHRCTPAAIAGGATQRHGGPRNEPAATQPREPAFFGLGRSRFSGPRESSTKNSTAVSNGQVKIPRRLPPTGRLQGYRPADAGPPAKAERRNSTAVPASSRTAPPIPTPVGTQPSLAAATLGTLPPGASQKVPREPRKYGAKRPPKKTAPR